MSDTFPIRSKRKMKGDLSPEDAEDDLSLEFFITKRSSSAERRRSLDVRVTDAGPGPNFLEILIFAASACLWLTSAILIFCHIVMVATRTSSYIYMIHHPRHTSLIILQIVSTAVEFCAAIFTTFCVNYDVEAHNVITAAKIAISLVSINIGIFISVLAVGSLASHKANKKNFDDPSCSGACGLGLDIIAHLFVGCSYEGVAINLCTIPVLVWVLKEAIVFVKLDLEARNEKAIVKESRSTTDLHHKRKLHHDFGRKVRFSRSTSSLIEAVIPEVKFFKKLPDTPVPNDANDMRDAVIRVMSEDLSSPENNNTAPSGMSASAGSKRPSGTIWKRQHSPADSASSVDPWSTTSPSTSDSGKEF